MNFDTLFDPIFQLPFMVGLFISIALPLLGVILRLRDEWLTALGFAYLSGISALLGMAVNIPVIVSAPVGAVAGALIKGFGKFKGNTIYAAMILIGWSGTMLIAANTALGHVMGHAMIEGQLYFAGTLQFVVTTVLLILIILSLPWLMPRLVRARFFPSHEKANNLPAWRWHLSFDLLVALGMAIGTGTIGLMAAFALIFIPPWTAFRIAKNWKNCLRISLIFGVVSYLLAFSIALMMDQPLGPVMVMVLILASGLIMTFYPRRH